MKKVVGLFLTLTLVFLTSAAWARDADNSDRDEQNPNLRLDRTDREIQALWNRWAQPVSKAQWAFRDPLVQRGCKEQPAARAPWDPRVLPELPAT